MRKLDVVIIVLILIAVGGTAANQIQTFQQALSNKNEQIEHLKYKVSGARKEIEYLNAEIKEMVDQTTRETDSEGPAETETKIPTQAGQTEERNEKVAVRAEPQKKADEPVHDKNRESDKRKRSGETDYRIAVGDVLSVRVWENPDLDSDTTVRPDGKITVALADEVRVAGMTISEIDEAITEKLKRFIVNPQVAVSLVKMGGGEINILGAVARPGVYNLGSGKTVLKALAAAGGTTDSASLNNIMIMKQGRDRKDSSTVTVNVRKLLAQGDGREDVNLAAGDTIFVPSATVTEQGKITVMGGIRKPGIYPLRTGSTILDAIALGGGAVPDAYLSDVVIIRGGFKNPTPLKTDIQAALNDGVIDDTMVLRENDVIYVPSRTQGLGGKKSMILVLGQVKRPGLYPLMDASTVLNAIGAAGGLSRDAVMKSVIVARRDKEEPEARRVDMSRAIKKGDMSQDMALESLDVVYVPRTFISNLNYFLTQVIGPVSKAVFATDVARDWEE